MKIKKRIPLIIVIVILLLFGYREYQHYVLNKDLKESYNSVIDFKNAETGQLKNSLELQVADNFVMKQNVLSEKVAKEQFQEELKGYKEITAYMKSEVMTSIRKLLLLRSIGSLAETSWVLRFMTKRLAPVLMD